MRVVLVGKTRQDIAATMLLAGIHNYNQTHVDDPLTAEFVTFGEYADQQTRSNVGSCITCIMVSEAALSECDPTVPGNKVPCLSLATAQAVVRDESQSGRIILHEDRHVVLVVPPTGFTAIDTAAAVLMGVSAVVEDRGLVLADVLNAVVNHKASGGRKRSVLLVGETLSRLEVTQDMVRQWNEDEGWDDAVDLNSWQACVALAQLDRLEPIVDGGGQPYSFTGLADALNLAEEKTGFRLTPNDLRRALSALAQRFLGADHRPVERGRLPDYVRARGFPRVPPTITGIPHGEMAGKLYHVVQDAEITCPNRLDQLPHGVVRLPQNLYRRYSHVR